MRVAVALLLAIVTLAGIGSAQIGKGQLAGVVLDQSGRAIVGATVTLTDLATGTSRVTTTNNEGQYQLRELPAGRYRIKVRRSGLAPFEENVTVKEGPQARDVTLRIATRRESIIVPAEVELPLAANAETTGAEKWARAQNAAELLEDIPGVSLQQGGDLASAPMLHGWETSGPTWWSTALRCRTPARIT